MSARDDARALERSITTTLALLDTILGVPSTPPPAPTDVVQHTTGRVLDTPRVLGARNPRRVPWV